MVRTVIKRDGRRERFDLVKLAKWGQWAARGIEDRVNWSAVMTRLANSKEKVLESTELHFRAINFLLRKKNWAANLMAGRLLAPMLYKMTYNQEHPPLVKELHTKLQGLGLMRHLDYSDEDYAKIESLIDHERDKEMVCFQLKQIYYKYGISNRKRVKGKGRVKTHYETPQFVFMRMAMALAEDEAPEVRMMHLENWYNHLSEGRINAPTPNYVNLGTPHRGLLSCCLYTTSDTASSLSIGAHIATEMTVQSAGIGGYIACRSEGDDVRGGSIVHQGKFPYIDLHSAGTLANTQGGRGGALNEYFIAYDPQAVELAMAQNPRTPVDKQRRKLHFTVMKNEFLTEKALLGEKVFTWNVYTAPSLHVAFFMGDPEVFRKEYERLEADEDFEKNYVDARELIVLFREQAIEVSTLYQKNTQYANLHTPFLQPIYSSNLCVAPETSLLTETGHVPIVALAGKRSTIWNGQEWSEVDVVQTGSNQILTKVKLSDGRELDSTKYHKWYVVDNYHGAPREVRTHELEIGQKLIKMELPVIEGNDILDSAYLNGFYTGDGTDLGNGISRVYLYGEKMNLLDKFGHDVEWRSGSHGNRLEAEFSGLMYKYYVPYARHTVKSRLDWLAGLLDADGCIYRNGENEAITLSSSNRDFLGKIQDMLQTLGVNAKITSLYSAGYRKLPRNDGSGQYGDFFCQETWRLLISSYDSQKLLELGLELKRLKIEKREVQRAASQFAYVVSIDADYRVADTYCVMEPKRHMAVFNGILTGQCVEIYQPTIPYENMMDLYIEEDHGRGEVSMCGLGGIVITRIRNDAEYQSAMFYSLRMIDKCIHQSEYRLPHVGFMAKQRLNAGVGILGLAHHMALLDLPYDSEEGLKEIHRVSERHLYFALRASLELGKELGNAPAINKTKWPLGWLPLDTYHPLVDTYADFANVYDWEQLRKEIVANGGIRNSTVVSHMPTESSSKASATTNGPYPIRDFALLKTDAKNSLDWCAPDSDLLKHQYQLAWDIKPIPMIKCYGVIQKWTDGGISADIYADRSEVIEIKKTAILEEDTLFMLGGSKGQYYYNTKTPVVAISDIYGKDFVESDEDEFDDDDLDQDCDPNVNLIGAGVDSFAQSLLAQTVMSEGSDSSGACPSGGCTL